MTTDTEQPAASAFDPSTFDTAAQASKILAFLKSMHPDGPWTITQISKEGALNFVTFTDRDQAPMMRWLNDRNGKTNLYWNVNPASVANAKSKLHHVTEVSHFHVDLDPRKGKDWQEERALIRRVLNDEVLLKQAGLPGLPSMILDSGGGYWGFWNLDKTITLDAQGEGARREAAAEVGRYNKRIEELFNITFNALSAGKGDIADDCHNVDRIARLPFTINYPSAEKLAMGRRVAPTEVVSYVPDRVYSLDQFTKSDVISNAAGVTDEEMQAIDIGTIQRTLPGEYGPFEIAEELKRQFPQIGEKCLELIVLGRYLDKEVGADDIDDKATNNGELDTNRSRAHWRVNRHLQQVEVPLNVILGILCDERLPISEYGRKPYNKKTGQFEAERRGRALIRFNENQIRHAVASILKQREREAAFDTLVNGPASASTDGSTQAAPDAPKGNGSAPSTVAQVVDYLNRSHAVLLQEGGKTRVLSWERSEIDYSREIPVLQTFDDFRNRYMHRLVSVGANAKGEPQLKPWGEVWLKNVRRKQYLSLRFLPGQPEEVDGYLNMWRGWAVEPKPGDWSLMERHIREVLSEGNEEVAEYILNWSAWTVQHPDEPAEVAMVFKGEKGTGKGVFARAIKRLFGQHGLQITSPAQLTGRFNSHLRDCCLLFADEAIVPEDKKAENVLKGLITEPELAVEGKGANVIQARNRLHIIMASNEDWVVPAGIDERRFAIFEVSSEHRQNEAYFKALSEQMEAGGLGAMLYALLQRDVGDWHPRRNIPKTEALRAQKEQSLGPVEEVLLAVLRDGVIPGEVTRRPNSVFSRPVGTGNDKTFLEYLGQISPRMRNMSEACLGRALKKWGCKRYSDGKRRGWTFPDLAVMREQWDARYWKEAWEDQLDWQSDEANAEHEDMPF